MRFKVENITPDRARRMLEHTERLGFANRSLVRARVEKLVHAIETDQWQITHQGIALRDDGAVIDGQHRLAAIIQAEIAVDMLVTRDVPSETFTVVDTARARTTSDSLRIAGFSDTNVLAAIARGYLAYREVVGTTESFEKKTRLLTTVDVVDFLDKRENSDAAHGALMAGRSTASALARFGLSSSFGVAALMCRLHPNELGHSTVAEFYARMADGAMLEASSPILALRRWCTSDTGYARVPNAFRRSVAIANTIKSMNDYALRRPRQVVAFRVGTEPYPAPLPVGSMRAHEAELERAEAERDA